MQSFISCAAFDQVLLLFGYRCSHSDCYFNLHATCALRLHSVEINECHKHPLTPLLNTDLFHCHGCGEEHEGPSFLCNTCEGPSLCQPKRGSVHRGEGGGERDLWWVSFVADFTFYGGFMADGVSNEKRRGRLSLLLMDLGLSLSLSLSLVLLKGFAADEIANGKERG